MDGTANSGWQQRFGVRTLVVATIIAALSVLLATTGLANVVPRQAREAWSPQAPPREGWFFKLPWADYAPSGVPDFDQRQDAWQRPPGNGPWTFCGPVAVANSFWWFDSKFEDGSKPPDSYPLVQSYGAWDDHSTQNVMPLVQDVAAVLHTDTGVAAGTYVEDLIVGVGAFLARQGVAADYDIEVMQAPSFSAWVVEQIMRSQDVILLLGFWQLQGDQVWKRIGGHYVNAVGYDVVPGQLTWVAFSDPYLDAAEAQGLGAPFVLPMHALHPGNPALHNDAQFVAHDPYAVVNAPAGLPAQWGPVDYTTPANSPLIAANFAFQNCSRAATQCGSTYSQGSLVTIVEWGVAVSPKQTTATPTRTATPLQTATPTSTGTKTRTATPRSTDTPTATATPRSTDTPTATATPRSTDTRTATPTPFWKAKGWLDYAPSGVPDFDQRQDQWSNARQQWSYCGPVAVANSLWWFDSKFEPLPVAPPVINDHYALVQSYSPQWDDHDPLNVPPLVQDLAWRMDTDGRRTGTVHQGTRISDMVNAVQQYLNDKGLAGWYTVTLKKAPTYDWVVGEVLRSEDVTLLLGFWEQLPTGAWRRVGGHYVTVPGVNSPMLQVAFSDPFFDSAETGGAGEVLPWPHAGGHTATTHNDARFVSHDAYAAGQTASPGGGWGPMGYTVSPSQLANFENQNVPEEFQQYSGEYGGGPLWVEVEYALAVSPAEATPTPTRTPSATATRTATATPRLTNTSTLTPVATATHTATRTATPRVTDTPTRTATPRVTDTPTRTATLRVTDTPTRTATPRVTDTPTRTATPRVTDTPTRTATPRVTDTPTRTATPRVTDTPTLTPTPRVTMTASQTATPRVTATPTQTETPSFFWKAGGWVDYAPSGMPDIDQKQDGWRAVQGEGQWTFCGPVAVANSLWWFDSKFEPAPQPPSVLNDHYPLVWSYNPQAWDDHDPRNVEDPTTPPNPNGELVEDLAFRMDTDGLTTGSAHLGTEVHAMKEAVIRYIADHGLRGRYSVTLVKSPDIDWVRREILRSEDVVLLLGFWQLQGDAWRRIGGHFVTAAGVDTQGVAIALSDPFLDAAEAGGAGRVTPWPHGAPHSTQLHNDVQFASHDVYPVQATASPGGTWGPEGYALDPTLVQSFAGQNTPAEFAQMSGTWQPGIAVMVEVEYALAVSPAQSIWLPVILYNRVGIQN